MDVSVAFGDSVGLADSEGECSPAECEESEGDGEGLGARSLMTAAAASATFFACGSPPMLSVSFKISANIRRVPSGRVCTPPMQPP